MNRHARIKLNTLALTLILAAASFAHAAEKPNIVFIMADDLGYGDVQCLNLDRGKIATPAIDRLAREGMTFTDVHSGSSVCTPTRYGVLTGRYAFRTRLQRGVLDGFAEPLIAAERLTVPALLKAQGYHTACIGKWHLGFTLEPLADGNEVTYQANQPVPVGVRTKDGPLTRGFEVFYGVQHARSMRTFFQQDRAVEHVPPIEALGKLSARATAYVRERAESGTPFFLYYALTSPHTPIVPSESWQGKSGLGAYGDFVMETDWAVGQVLAAIDKAGIAENTLVIFTSDNGCSPAADIKKLEAQGHYPSAQYRGYKADIWDGGHRVPFFARWPGKIQAGSSSDALLCLSDLMATSAELTGAALPDSAGEDSFSFLPELLGTGRTARRSAVHHSINGKFAIREGSTKLALCSGSGGWSKETTEGPVQLYDLASDTGERRNLASAQPEAVARLTAALDAIIDNGRSTPGERQKNDVPKIGRPWP